MPVEGAAGVEVRDAAGKRTGQWPRSPRPVQPKAAGIRYGSLSMPLPRFRLRSLLIAVAVAAIIFAVVHWRRSRVVSSTTAAYVDTGEVFSATAEYADGTTERWDRDPKTGKVKVTVKHH